MSCPDCFSGHVHDGLSTGREAKVHGRDTYIAEPNKGPVKGLIVIITDAFGWQFVNNKILADHYASRGGYKVYMPDFMDGTAADISLLTFIQRVMDKSSIWAWLTKPYYICQLIYHVAPYMYYNRFGQSWPKVKSFFEAVRNDEAENLPIGAAGFCWGGQHTVVLSCGEHSINGKPLLDAAFAGHPSSLSIPGDFEQVKIPLSIAIGDEDSVMTMPKIKQAQAALKQLEDVESEIVVYPKAGHGFCIRADLDHDVAKQAIDAEEQAISWFSKHFEIAGY